MPSLTEWKVPPANQPRAADYSFDLDHVLASVVGLHSIIPTDAFSADSLGTERAGNGVVIDDGLVLTIGYLITEAETVWLHLGDGRVVPGHALGFDQATGFGLVQALGRIDLDPLPIGSSADGPASATAWWSAAPAAAPGRSPARSPPSRNSPVTGNICWTRRSSPIPRIRTGAAPALISNRGELIGIGSLQLEREREGKPEHVNMIVPIDLLEAGARRFAQIRPRQQAGAALARDVLDRDRQQGRGGRHLRQGARRRAPNSRPATSSSP